MKSSDTKLNGSAPELESENEFLHQHVDAWPGTELQRFRERTLATDRFESGEWIKGLTGVPVLADASVNFECELTNAVDQATHRVLFGHVIDIRENQEQATLLYCMRRYLNG